MMPRHISQCLVFATLLALAVPILHAQDTPQRLSPARNWGLSFTFYSQFREDYHSLPLRVVNMRGGKLSPNEKFKIEVTGLENRSNKSISYVEFAWYLFDNTDLNKLVDSGKSPLITLTLSPNENRTCEILVVHIEDIPFLQTNPKGTFMLEVGVAKIVYLDGSTWEAAASPGKFVHEKGPCTKSRFRDSDHAGSGFAAGCEARLRLAVADSEGPGLCPSFGLWPGSGHGGA